jgi:hypothetical protein
LFNAGKADFYEKLNENSDLPKDVFEKEKEGAINPKDSQGRGLGAVLPEESEWYTHPELEALYQSRQTAPATYDATTKGCFPSLYKLKKHGDFEESVRGHSKNTC